MDIYNRVSAIFLRFLISIACCMVFILILPGGPLISKAAWADEGPTDSGWGWVTQTPAQANVKAEAKGKFTDLSVSWDSGAGGGSDGISVSVGRQPAGGSSGGGSGGSWDPDEDPAYQRALRQELMSDDDSIFFNPRQMEAAQNRTTYSLQDPCNDEEGGALDDCRQEQECTVDGGGEGVNMDIVVGRAGEEGRASRGTQMCVANADAAAADDEGFIPLPVFTLQDFKRLNVAPAVSTVEPAPDTLKNLNTNVFAVADAQMFQTELGGFPVAVRAYPVQYTWNYGDGTTLGPTPLTGAPLTEGDWDIPTETT